MDAGCAEAYLAKFMAEYNISQEEYIPELCSDMIAEIDSLFDITTYNKASRFGDEELNKKLTEYNNGAIYNYADHRMHHVNPDDNASKQYYDTEKIFKRISGFKDSDKKAQECLDKAKEHEENAKKRVEKLREENYNNAVKFMEGAQTGEDHVTAMEKFRHILGYSDSQQKYDECRQKIYGIADDLWENAQSTGDIDKSLFLFRSISEYKDSQDRIRYIEENRANYTKEILKNQIKEQIKLIKEFCQKHKKAIIISGCVCLLIILLIVFFAVALPKIKDTIETRSVEKKYSMATGLLENSQYEEAEPILLSLGAYRDSSELLKEARYNIALEKISNGDYGGAASTLSILHYKDSEELAIKLNAYIDANYFLNNGEYEKAKKAFEALGDYADTPEKVLEADYQYAMKLFDDGKYLKARNRFRELEDYSDSATKALEANYLYAMILFNEGDYTKAKVYFEEISDYKDSKAKAEEAAEKLSGSRSDTITIDNGSNTDNVTIETNIFDFDGGYIEYTEYTYYEKEDEYYTKYTTFSAVAVLDDYPESEGSINNALAQIGHIPSEAELAASKAPEEYYYGMMQESSTIAQVYAENNYLFITVSSFSDGGGGVSMSIWGSETTYLFDISTGKQITIDKLFNNFEKVKQLAVEYADAYIKENVPYEDRSSTNSYPEKPYYDMLKEDEWYTSGSWTYDGKNLTIDFGWIFASYMYKHTYVAIPVSEIRPYFSSSRDSGGTSSDSSKLADIVGHGVVDYAPPPDITVGVSLADISRSERTELINDLEYDVNMHELIAGNDGNYFYKDYNLIGSDEYGETEYYLLDDSLETVYNNARNSFSENFISSDKLTEIMISGKYPRFTDYEGYAVWYIVWPSPSEQYDYDNAGVVSYSDTKAEVWIAYSSPIEGTFDVRSFSMTRNNASDQWKIDKVQDVGFRDGEITYHSSHFSFN